MAGPNQQRLQDLIAPPAAKMVEGPNRKRLRKTLADQGLDLDQELANQQQAAAQRRAQRASARAATGSSQQPAGSSDWLVDLNPDIELIRQGKDPKAEWADELREDQEQLARTLEEIQNSNIPDYEKRRLIAEGTKRQDKSWLFDALDWLDKLDAGARSVFGTIQYALDSDADRSWEALSGVYAKGIADNISWSEILDEYEMPFLNYWLRDETDALNPNSNKQMQEDPGGWSALGRAFLTFSLDTATSPTTYLTGGAKPLTNLAADGGMALYRLADQTAVAATKAGDVVDAGRIAEVATRTAEVGYRGLKQSERKVLEEGLRKYNTMPEGVKNLQGGAYLGRKVLVPGSRQIASVTTQPLARAMAGARQSSAFKSMASPFNTVTTMLKAEMRSGDQAKVSQAMETLASVQLAKADAMRWFVNTQSELDGIIRGIKKNKIDREELSLFIEDPAAALNMASPSALRLAGRYLEEPAVKKVVDEAIDWQGRALKDDFNRIVGEEVIETMDNYVPTLMSEDFLAKAVKGPKRRVAEFTTATFQRGAKFKVGEEYMGEMIVPTEMHPRNLTPKQQGEDILRRNFGEEFVGPLYNRDWVKAAKSRTFVAHVRLRGEMTAKYMRERGVGFTADDIAKMSQSPITDVGDSLRTWGFRKRTETAMAARQAAADSGAFVETSGTRVLKDIRAIEEITSQGGTLKVLDDQLAATGGFVADRIEQVRKLVGRRAQLAERHRRIESKLTTDVGRMLQRVRQGGTATDKEMDAAAKLTAWAAGIEPDDIARINQTWDDIDNELAQYMADLDLDADDVGTVNDLVNGMLSNASNRLDTIDDLLAIPQANLSNQEILRRVQLAKERDYLLESMEGLVKMRANMDEVETLVRDVDRVRSGFTQERAFEVALWRIKQNPTLTAAQKRAASRNLFRNAPRTARRDLNSRAVDRLVEINAKGRLTRRNGELAEFVATPKGMKIAKAQSGIEDLTIDALSGAAGRDSAVELIGRTVYYSDDAAAAGLDADELRRIQVNVAMKNPRVVAGVEDADRIVDAEMLLSAVAAKLVDFGPKKELTATQRVFVNGLNAVFKRHSAAVAADEGPEAVSRFIDDLDATLGRLAAGDNPNPIAADFVNQAGGRIADQGLTPEAALQVRKDLEGMEAGIQKWVDSDLDYSVKNIERVKQRIDQPAVADEVAATADEVASEVGEAADKVTPITSKMLDTFKKLDPGLSQSIKKASKRAQKEGRPVYVREAGEKEAAPASGYFVTVGDPQRGQYIRLNPDGTGDVIQKAQTQTVRQTPTYVPLTTQEKIADKTKELAGGEKALARAERSLAKHTSAVDEWDAFLAGNPTYDEQLEVALRQDASLRPKSRRYTLEEAKALPRDFVATHDAYIRAMVKDYGLEIKRKTQAIDSAKKRLAELASEAQAEPDVTDELTAAFEANRQARAEFEAIEAEMKPISDAEKAAWERYKAARQAADRAASPNATADPELEFSLSKRMLEGIRNIVGEKPPAATRKELDELDLLIKYVPDADGNLPQITPEDLEMIRSNYRTLKPRMTVPDRPILDRSMTDERVPGVWWTDSYRLLSQDAVNPATGFKLPPYLGGPVDLTDLLPPAQLKELDGIADASRLPRKFASSDEFYAAVTKLTESSRPFALSKVGSNLDVIASKYAPDAGQSPNFASLMEGAPTPTDGVVVAPRSVSFQSDMHIVLESADGSVRAEVNAGYFSDLADGITIVARQEDGDTKPLALYIGDKLVGLMMPIRLDRGVSTREIVGNRVRELLTKLTSRSKTTTDGQRRALYDLDSEIAATRRSGSTATQDLDEARRALDELGMVPNDSRLYDMPRSQRLQELGERYQELLPKLYSSEDALRQQRLNRVRQELEGDELGDVYAEGISRLVDEDIAGEQQRVANIEAFLARAPKESAKWVKANYPRAAGMVPSSTPKDKLIAAAKKSLAEIRKRLDEAATPQGREVVISEIGDGYDPLEWVERLIENADADPALRTLAEDLLRRVDQPSAAAAATPPPAPLANEVAATPAVDPQQANYAQRLEKKMSIDSERIRLIEETMLSRGAALDAEDPKKLAIELERLERQVYGTVPPDGRVLEFLIEKYGSPTEALRNRVAQARDDMQWNRFDLGREKGDRKIMREEIAFHESYAAAIRRTVAGEALSEDELVSLGRSYEGRIRRLQARLEKADELRRSITSAAAPPRLSAFLLIDELVSPAMTSMSPKRAEELLARNPASGALLRRLGYTPEQVAENYRTAMKKLGYDGILTDDLVKRSATVFDEKQIRHANKVAQVEAELDALQRELRSSIRDGQRSLLSMSHDAFGFRIDRQTDKVEDAVAVAADNASKLAAMERTEQNVAEYLMRSEAQKVFKAAEGQSDEAAAALRLHGQAMVAEADMLANGRGNVSEMMSGNLAATPGLAERMASMNGLMFKQLDRQTFADPNIVEILTHAQKLTIPGEMKGFLRAFDYVTNVFKGYAILSPGFHIRNLFGAAMNNWLADMNVMSYRRFGRAESVYFAALREHGNPDKALLAVRAKLGDDIGGAYEQWHAMEASTGMGLAGAWGEDVGRTTTILGNQQTSGRLANAGRAISGDQYGLREQAFSLKNNALVRGNGYVAQRVERFMRGSLAFDSLYRGEDVINASLRVRKYHFDYNDLSALEENVLRRVIPFYVWVSRNLPLQVEGLIRKPKVALSFYRLKRNIEAQSEAEAYTPGWYAREFSIRLPRNLNIPFFSNDGNAKYLFLDMPFMDLGLFQDPVGGSLSAVNPWIKAPVEMFVRDGKFFTGAPFSDKPVPLPDNFAGAALGQALLATGRAQRATDGTIMTNEKILYAIEQGMPMFGLLNRALDPDKAANVFVSKFLGIGIRSNDERSQSNEIQRRLSFLNDKIGVFGKDGLGYDISPTGKIEITNNTRKVELNAERLQFERNFLLDAANTMDAQTLADTIPEVGESTARWIVAHRVANGRFNSLSDLGKVQDLRRPQIDTILLALAEKPEKMGIPSQNMVDLNTSSVDELAEALPGVGPSTAKKIIDYRRTYGEIRTVDDLRNIKGLSDSAVDEIRDYLLEELMKRSTAEYRRYLQQAGYRPLQELVLTP